MGKFETSMIFLGIGLTTCWSVTCTSFRAYIFENSPSKELVKFTNSCAADTYGF